MMQMNPQILALLMHHFATQQGAQQQAATAPTVARANPAMGEGGLGSAPPAPSMNTVAQSQSLPAMGGSVVQPQNPVQTMQGPMGGLGGASGTPFGAYGSFYGAKTGGDQGQQQGLGGRTAPIAMMPKSRL